MKDIVDKRNNFLVKYFENYRDLKIEIVFQALPVFLFGEDRYVLEWRSINGDKIFQLNDFGLSNKDTSKRGKIINYFLEELVASDGTQLTLFVNDAELLIDTINKSIEMFFYNEIDNLKNILNIEK
ncbi:MAG: hypothetical protein KBH06_06640 [Spirochaetes bacterium]|nr:hypothetical protein [Spirochaetota bacterium]MBP9022863.1 hypothetical protein [Spirochaetota bacterium]